MKPLDTKMLLLTLIGCLWTLLFQHLIPNSDPSLSNSSCSPSAGLCAQSGHTGRYKRLFSLQGVCSLVGDILKQIARTSASQAVCHASYPQAVPGFPRATTTAMFFSCSVVLIFLCLSNSCFLVSLILWASLNLCRESTLQEYLSPSYIFASVSHLLIHSFNINQIPTLHHPLDLKNRTVNKTAKNVFPCGTYHLPGTYFYLSDIPFLLLKMSSHDDFDFLKSGRF